MSKAILILDMPKMCDDCMFYRCMYDEDDDYVDVCMALRETIDDCYNKKYDGCPLRELPEKQICYTFNDCDNASMDGWNACLDEILGV